MPTRNRHSYSATRLRTTDGNVSVFVHSHTDRTARRIPPYRFRGLSACGRCFRPIPNDGSRRGLRSEARNDDGHAARASDIHTRKTERQTAQPPPAGSESDTVRRLSPAQHTPEKVRFAERYAPRPTAPHKTSPERTGPTFGRTVPSGLVSNTTVPLRHPRRSGGFIGGPSACGAAGRPHQMERIFSVLSNSRLTGFWFLIALLNGM